MLAIIPARGGSKSIPQKNLRILDGKPLIAYPIEAAQRSRQIDRIIVSTDDKEIAAVARDHNADVPFLRSKELAQDKSMAIDAFLYTLDRLEAECSKHYDAFIALHATAPLTRTEDIEAAIKIFYDKNADSLFSVCELGYPPHWARKIGTKGQLMSYFDDFGHLNRQEFEKAFVPNGALCVFKTSLLKEQYSFYSDLTYPYIMPRERSVDIDDYFDLELAEFLMKKTCKT